MLLPTLLTFALVPLAVVAGVANQKQSWRPNYPGGFTSTCVTVSGNSPARGRMTTSTSTKTLPPTTTTLTRTSTVVVTVTPKVTTTVTSTATSTATTVLPASTTVVTSTSTSVSTASTSTVTITTVTSTSTATESTTSTSTSTVPPPAGFTPVYDSSGYTSLNGVPEQKRAVLEVLRNVLRSSPASLRTDSRGRERNYNAQYVKCVSQVQSTSSAFTTVTVTRTSTAVPTTISVTSTLTVTTTSTSVPPVVTSTVTTTTTSVTTSTSTITNTATNTATTTTTQTITSVFTFYQACATNNILGPQIQDGRYVQGVGNSDPNGIIVQAVTDSAYDCCVACLLGTFVSNCQNAIFGAADDGNICNVIGGNPAACPNGQTNQFGSYVLLSNTPFQRYDSNGPCGVLGPDPAG